MTLEPDVVLPAQIVGPSLSVAGFASWVFANAGRDHEAAQCGELQELIDAALRQGAAEIRVARPVAEHAAHLWIEASSFADDWATTTEGATSAEWGRHAERLRIRARSIRRLLDERSQ